MTVEFFDLAQRLYAAKTGQPVLRVASSLFQVAPTAIYLDTARDPKGKISFTVSRRGERATIVRGVEVLRALAAAGAVMEPQRPSPQLITPDAAALTALEKIARGAARHDDPVVASAAAVVGWWADRSGYPGSNAVVNLLDQTRQRFITGTTPEWESTAAYWRRVFVVDSGAAGLAQWALRVSAGFSLPMLAPIIDDDANSFLHAAERFAKGWNWTRPEPAAIAAMALRARCDTADLWEAALLSDRLWRHRATHTGHVTGGEVVSSVGTTFTLSCPRMGSRLRAGSAVVGWIGGVDNYDRASHFDGEVQTAEAADGSLQLKIGRVRTADRPSRQCWVTLMPAPPNTRIVRMGRMRYSKLLFKGGSWITTGKAPGVRRRDVPLDVLCAAAETE